MPEIKTMSAGPAVPVPTLVQCDQVTVFGDGSRERPLRAATGGGQSSFTASFVPSGALPGMPVRISGTGGSGGLNAVALTSVSPVAPSVPSASAAASAYGVVTEVHGDGTVQVSTSGLVVLTTAQWDAVTGGSGGLSRGAQYYAALGARISGALSLSGTAPTTPGIFRTRVGIALNATTLLLAQVAPVQVHGDQIVFGAFAGPTLILGSAVFVSASGVVAAASDTGASNAQAIGVVAALDDSSQPIVQIAGVVTLTQAQWAAVTDTGGLTADAYYVWDVAHAGHLTGTAPTSSPRLQVGKPISATQLAITPYLQRIP